MFKRNDLSTDTPPVILVTNDDGIASPGLLAAVQAVLPLGDVHVVAPACQWSGAGRSMSGDILGGAEPYSLELDGQPVAAHQIDASPALVVAGAMLGLLPARPALVVSGVNYGENLGSDVTISGTVGAALQGAVSGVPALAVSLETPRETHYAPSDGVDFSAAIHFARYFARWMLGAELPFDVDGLKVDVPGDATPDTAWRLTRISRHPYFVPTAASAEERAAGAKPIGYDSNPDLSRVEPDSDIYALVIDRVVSVSPVSLDLTARVHLGELEERMLAI